MNASELDNLTRTNVVRLVFQKKTTGIPREMLCTKSDDLLDSPLGHTMLGYKRPTNVPKYDPISENNLIVWDIESRGFRTVSCDTCKILETIPALQFKTSLVESI